MLPAARVGRVRVGGVLDLLFPLELRRDDEHDQEEDQHHRPRIHHRALPAPINPATVNRKLPRRPARIRCHGVELINGTGCDNGDYAGLGTRRDYQETHGSPVGCRREEGGGLQMLGVVPVAAADAVGGGASAWSRGLLVVRRGRRALGKKDRRCTADDGDKEKRGHVSCTPSHGLCTLSQRSVSFFFFFLKKKPVTSASVFLLETLPSNVQICCFDIDRK